MTKFLTKEERQAMFAYTARNGEPLEPPWDVLQRYEATVRAVEEERDAAWALHYTTPFPSQVSIIDAALDPEAP